MDRIREPKIEFSRPDTQNLDPLIRRLVDGYGRIAGASGSFTLHGDFIFFAILDFPGFVAAWYPELEGKFCR